MQTFTERLSSITDKLTGHVYKFSDPVVAGQYQDGTWFVVQDLSAYITSVSPVGTIQSTRHWRDGKRNDDTLTSGLSHDERILHGLMKNPNQGAKTHGYMGFDSFSPKSLPDSTAVSYHHALNIDPSITGKPIRLEEGSYVKAESRLTEPEWLNTSYSNAASEKTMLDKLSCLTVVLEIPKPGSFRPPIRGKDKRSYWTIDDIQWSERSNKVVQGLRSKPLSAFNVAVTGSVAHKARFIQQTFLPFQEAARRWNPGARGGGFGIYGNAWYNSCALFFEAFLGDYPEEHVSDLLRAAIQIGIDIHGLVMDGGSYPGWQAHHAGRKAVMMLAGFLLSSEHILNEGDADEYPTRFGVDDGYCGYVSPEMLTIPRRFYKGSYSYEWTEDQVGLPEWAGGFAWAGDFTEQVNDPDIARRSYQVLSFDNGMLWHHVFAMTIDPDANYWRPAYFDFTDRYLGIRFGDYFDGKWDTHRKSNGHFTGNWWSIRPSKALLTNIKKVRNAIPRPSSITKLKPEALPPPNLTASIAEKSILVELNDNNFRFPQHRDAKILGYDLRWIAYAGESLAAITEEDQVVNDFEWVYIYDVKFPFKLSNAPGGYKIKVQVRMNNVNGNGPFLDGRYLENFDRNAKFKLLGSTAGDRYATNLDVPMSFMASPQNWRHPNLSPRVGVIAGTTVSLDDGVWSANPEIINVSHIWQISSNGTDGWVVMTDTVGGEYIVRKKDEGKYLRAGVKCANSVQASAISFSESILVSRPILSPLYTGRFESKVKSIKLKEPLGGKKLLVVVLTRKSNKAVGLTIDSSVSTPVFIDNKGPEERYVYYIDVPASSSSNIVSTALSARSSVSIAIWESSKPLDTNTYWHMNHLQAGKKSNPRTFSIETPQNGCAIFFGRCSTPGKPPDNSLVGGDLVDQSGADDNAIFGYLASTNGSMISASVKWVTLSNATGHLMSFEAQT